MLVATSEVVRDINKRVILNLIRTRQPISRADLARASGLQRSTVSLIVEELIEDNWVLEGPTGRLPRGRRPTFLRLNDDRVIIGVDVRPIQITVALADVNGRFTSQETMATPVRSEGRYRWHHRAHPTPVALVPRKESGRHRHQPAGPRGSRFRASRVRAKSEMAGYGNTQDRREGHRPRCGAGKCCQRVRARGGLVRSCAIDQHGGSDSVRGDRRRHSGGWPPGARRQPNGGRVRPRASRSQRPALQLRQPWMLGGIRVQPRSPALLPRIECRAPTD